MNLYKSFFFIISSYLFNINIYKFDIGAQLTKAQFFPQGKVDAQVTGQPGIVSAQKPLPYAAYVSVSTIAGSSETVNPQVITQGSILLSNFEDLFVNLAYSYPFISSAINQYITSHVSLNIISNFEPIFIQMPYLFTISNNLINGQYTLTNSIQNNLIINTYNVEYNDNEYVNIITFYNPDTNILFFELPRQISYDSAEQLSFSFSEINSEEINGRMIVPESWLTNLPSNGIGRILETIIFSGINSGINNSNNTDIPTNQSVASADVLGCTTYSPLCQNPEPSPEPNYGPVAEVSF